MYSLLYTTFFAEVSKCLLIRLVILRATDVLPLASLLCPEEIVVVVQVLYLVEQHVGRLLQDPILSRLLQCGVTAIKTTSTILIWGLGCSSTQKYITLLHATPGVLYSTLD